MNVIELIKIIRAESRSAKNENVQKNKDIAEIVKTVSLSVKGITEMMDRMLDLSDIDCMDYREAMKNEVNFCFDSIADIYFYLYLESVGDRKSVCVANEERLRGMKI